MSCDSLAAPANSTSTINELAIAITAYFAGTETQSTIQLFIASVSFGERFALFRSSTTHLSIGFLTALVLAALIFLM